MLLQTQEAAQLKDLTLIFHSSTNQEIEFYLPQPSWTFGINLVKCSMQRIVRQCFSITLHNREMFKSFEVIHKHI